MGGWVGGFGCFFLEGGVVPNVFLKMFPIAPHFFIPHALPTIVLLSPTYIGGPKG